MVKPTGSFMREPGYRRMRSVVVAAVLLVLVATVDGTGAHPPAASATATLQPRSRAGPGVRGAAVRTGGGVHGAGSGMMGGGPRRLALERDSHARNSSRARRAVEEPSPCAGIARLGRPRAERHVDKLDLACPFRGLPCPDNIEALVKDALDAMKAMTQEAIVDEGITSIVGGSYMMEVSTRAIVQVRLRAWRCRQCCCATKLRLTTWLCLHSL